MGYKSEYYLNWTPKGEASEAPSEVYNRPGSGICFDLRGKGEKAEEAATVKIEEKKA